VSTCCAVLAAPAKARIGAGWFHLGDIDFGKANLPD
jgi:hypothetical protein